MKITQQTLENPQNLADMPLEDFTEKIERAKKLFELFNGVTFGDKIESAKSRIVLKQIL